MLDVRKGVFGGWTLVFRVMYSPVNTSTNRIRSTSRGAFAGWTTTRRFNGGVVWLSEEDEEEEEEKAALGAFERAHTNSNDDTGSPQSYISLRTIRST